MQAYFLDNDDNGHWYLIPAERREEWVRWSNTGWDWEDDFADEANNWLINGGPSSITFFLQKELEQ